MMQKRPSFIGVLREKYSENMQQIYREHPWRSKISVKLPCNFIESTLRYGCSLVNLLHLVRTPFPVNTSGEFIIN